MLIKQLIILYITLIYSITSNATGVSIFAPMSPQAKLPPGNFSTEVLKDFNLFATAGSPQTLYYVSKLGTVSVSTNNGNFVPELSIFNYTPLNGIFENEELLYISGNWDTSGNQKSLDRLKIESEAQGLQPLPLPVSRSFTSFIMTTSLVENGRLNVLCEKDNLENLVCSIPSNQSGSYDVNTNIIYQYISIPSHTGTLDNKIPFQAITMPGVTDLIKQKLTTGNSWDDYIIGKVSWIVDGQSGFNKVKLNINWPALFQQMETFAEFHDYSCTDSDLDVFFKKLSLCQDPLECGVSWKYQTNSGDFRQDPPDEIALKNAIFSIKQYLNNHLFNEINVRSIGSHSNRLSSIYVPRSNPERRNRKQLEEIELKYSKGTRAFEVSTVLSLSCLVGDLNTGEIFFDKKSSHCENIFQNGNRK